MLFRTTPGGGLRNVSASITTSKGGDPGAMGALVGRIPRGPGRRMGDVVVTGGGTLLPPTQPTGFQIPKNTYYATKAIAVPVLAPAARAQSLTAQASAAAAVVGPAMQKAVIHGAIGPSGAPPSGPVTSPTNDPSQSPTPTATYLNQQAQASAAASGGGTSTPAAVPLSPSQLGFSTSDTSDSSVSPQDPGSTTAAVAAQGATATAATPTTTTTAATPATSSPSTWRCADADPRGHRPGAAAAA